MTYDIEFKPRAFKDLKALPKSTRQRIVDKIEELAEDLTGDVKRLEAVSKPGASALRLIQSAGTR